MKPENWKRKNAKLFEEAERQRNIAASFRAEASHYQSHLNLLSNKNKSLNERITYYRTQAELAAIYLNLAAEYFASLSIEASAQAFRELSIQTRRPFASE